MAEQKRVLIIDDEPDILKVIVFRLKKAGYEIIVSDNGKDGIDCAKKQRPDLILLDLYLPVIDGYEVCKRIKSDQDLKKIPIIFITASQAAEVKDKMQSSGADDYIIKPFEPAELLQKIEKYIK